MKRTLLFIMALVACITLPAAEAINGQVKGRVLNGDEGIPFENVTVAVYSLPDSSVTTGVATGADGEFIISDLPAGDYLLSASFVGYRGKSFSFRLSEEADVFDVGEIVLTESAEEIGGVDVIGVRPQIIYRDSKKILKVKEFQAAGANTLAEVLENAPSITLDAEGNVLLRGSGNYTLLIDGKPVPGVGVNMLRQIPPEMVEEIEIMTNPSAKYDPDGVTGIINLVLKKQKEPGNNAQLSLMAGLKGKYNGDLQYNSMKGKTNFFAGVTGTSYNTSVEGEIYRLTGVDTDESEINNLFGQESRIKTVVGNLGFDFTMNDRNSLTMSGRFGPQRVNALVDNGITREVTDPLLTGNFNFSNDLYLEGVFYMPNITWNHKFRKEGSSLQTNLFAGGFTGNLSQGLSEEVTDASFNPTGSFTDMRNLSNEMALNDIRIKTDYTMARGESGKIEAGYQYRRLLESNDQSMEYYDFDFGQWISDAGFRNDLSLDRAIQSLYATLSGGKGKISYQAGLRGEYTVREVNEYVSGENYSYRKTDIFPSASITMKVSDKSQMQGSYSRRINRPGRNQLNPFPQFADNQLIVSGNPDLKPEFIDSYELSYQSQVKTGFLSAEGYYRRVNDLMTNVLTPEAGGVMRQTFINANRSHSAGAELMANVQAKAWLRLIASGNLYYYKLDDEMIYSGNDDSRVVWNSNVTAVILPFKGMRFTLTGVYNGPSINLQGTQKASWMVNAGARQDILKGKASLSLGVRDLFASFVIENELAGEDYVTITSIRPESRVATLTFTYNFNNYRRRAQDEEMDLNFIR